ncbi:LPXTG cell wall anchor domain-containing protein [Streptomyces sp. NPDC047017]|uniref:LPXTG cell wall anchor domain-containing protein n=1 Tax=Streptomyces sp. NPDC047017 TaxID=3155024 RepID=UPI0033D4FC05
MTKKTRIRVARIAAGAVIAAGASLMVTGVASADPGDNDPGCGLLGTCPTTEPTTPGTTEPTDPGTTIPTDPGTTKPTDPGTTKPTDPGTTQPTDPGTTKPTDPSNGGTGNNGGNQNGGTGNNGGNQNGGTGNNGGAGADNGGGVGTDGNQTVPQEQGSSALTDTGSQAPANATPQGNGKQLAETGAGETTFLLIGAATMIAGGIGFRVLPRVMAGRGGTAA